MINNSVATEVFFEPSAVASCLERPPKYIKKDCVYCQIDVSRTLWKQLGGYWRKGTELTLSKPTSGVGSMFVKQIDHDGKRITIKRNQPVIKCNVAYDAYMSYDYEVLSYKSRAATTDEIFGKMYNVIGVLPVPKQ
jgi:hypothetical protein